MGLTVIVRTKPFGIKFGDAEIQVKAPTQDEEQQLIEQHTVDGVLNEQAHTIAYLDACVLGWTGVKDQTGADVPFDKAMLWHLRFDGMDPAQVVIRILACVRGVDDPLAVRSRTSLPTLSGDLNGNAATQN